MSTSAAKLQAKATPVVSEHLRQRFQAKTQAKSVTKETVMPSPNDGNPLFKMMLDNSVSPEARRDAFAQFMTTTLDKEKDEANVKHYEEFREFLMYQSTVLAENIIKLTNTKTFASLQQIIIDMQGGLLDFEKERGPLMELIDGIHALRTSDNLHSAFEEIENETKHKEEIEAKIAAEKKRIEDENLRIEEIRMRNAQLAQQRSLFGFGGIKEEARSQIARNEVALEAAKENLEKIKENVSSLELEKNVPPSNLPPDMVANKEKLREFLDLSSGENIARMERLRDSGLNFIEKSRTSTQTIRDEFGNLTEQISQAETNNQNMTSVYAIMVEGSRDAAKRNMEVAAELKSKKEGAEDNLIAKMQIETQERNVNDHSKLLHTATTETVSTLHDLSIQALRVGNLKETTRQNIDIARNLNTQGVASTSDGIASVVTVIAGAAISESAAIADQALVRMQNNNNDLLQKSLVGNALAIDKTNSRFVEMFETLSNFKETSGITSEITRQGLESLNSNLEAVYEKVKELNESGKEAAAINTELGFVAEGKVEAVEALKKVNDNSFFK